MSGKVMVYYLETKLVCIGDKNGEVVEILSETPEGITIKWNYRKGERQEFIPRSKIERIVYSDTKADRKPQAAKVAKPKPEAAPAAEPVPQEPVVEEDTDTILSESEEFDDEDEFYNDEFE